MTISDRDRVLAIRFSEKSGSSVVNRAFSRTDRGASSSSPTTI